MILRGAEILPWGGYAYESEPVSGGLVAVTLPAKSTPGTPGTVMYSDTMVKAPLAQRTTPFEEGKNIPIYASPAPAVVKTTDEWISEQYASDPVYATAPEAPKAFPWGLVALAATLLFNA